MFSKTRPARTIEGMQEFAVVRESELFHITQVGKAEQPLLIPRGACEDAARPGPEAAEPCFELISTAKFESPKQKLQKSKPKEGARVIPGLNSTRCP